MSNLVYKLIAFGAEESNNCSIVFLNKVQAKKSIKDSPEIKKLILPEPLDIELYCLIVGQKFVAAATVNHNDDDETELEYLSVDDRCCQKGYGRKLLEHVCDVETRSGRSVFAIDITTNGSGDSLYGGVKTREKFDVRFSIVSGEYVFSRKKSVTRPLQYDRCKGVDINRALDHSVNLCFLFRHLCSYLYQNSDQAPEIDSARLSRAIIRGRDKYGKSEENLKYYESLVKELESCLKKSGERKKNTPLNISPDSSTESFENKLDVSSDEGSTHSSSFNFDQTGE